MCNCCYGDVFLDGDVDLTFTERVSGVSCFATVGGKAVTFFETSSPDDSITKLTMHEIVSSKCRDNSPKCNTKSVETRARSKHKNDESLVSKSKGAGQNIKHDKQSQDPKFQNSQQEMPSSSERKQDFAQ